MPHIARITLYPIKSLDGLTVGAALVLPSGALQYDRRWAIFDAHGNVVNGKRNLKVHRLRAAFSADVRMITLRIQGHDHGRQFDLSEDPSSLEQWLGSFLGMTVVIKENSTGGFPDDLDSPGPTVISTASLEAVASWFPSLTLDEVRARFRANIEIDGVEPFWEDGLYGEKGEDVRFQVGDVLFEGVNPCQRCVVPSRNPQTGTVLAGFQKMFAERRRETLPHWANANRFDHFYRLAVNTRLGEQRPAMIREGDAVRVV